MAARGILFFVFVNAKVVTITRRKIGLLSFKQNTIKEILKLNQRRPEKFQSRLRDIVRILINSFRKLFAEL